MFARIKKNTRTKRRSVIICHNVRVGKKIRQFTLKVFGHSANEAELQEWLSQANQWIKEQGEAWFKQNFPKPKQTMSRQVSLFNLQEEARINVGVEDIFGQLYEEFGFQNLLSPLHQKTLRKVLFARILEPGSKRRLSLIVESKLDDMLPVERIYRMMDALSPARLMHLILAHTYLPQIRACFVY